MSTDEIQAAALVWRVPAIFRSTRIWRLVFSVCPILFADGLAFGQEASRQLEEIIVVAQKRVEALQDVPVSVNAVDGSKISSAGIHKMQELQAYVPGMAMSETALNSNISIRGIFSGANQGFEQSVGTYVDGIYHGRAQQARIPFFDLERVEVLRGSQSILFGNSSIAGAINVISAKPTDQFEGRFSTLYEHERNERIVSGVISGPFSENFRGRLALQERRLDGHIRNLTLDRTEANRDELNVRGTLEWDIGDKLDVSLKVDIEEFDVVGRDIEIITDLPAEAGPFAGLTYGEILVLFGQHPSVLNATQDYARSANADYSNDDFQDVVLTVNYRFDNFLLTSISGISGYDFDEICDCDFTGANLWLATQNEEFDQFSQELRVTSMAGERLNFLAGLFYQTSEQKFFDSLLINDQSVLIPVVNAVTASNSGDYLANTGTPRNFRQDADRWSLFGQLTWGLTDRMRLAGGLRLVNEEKRGMRTLAISDINFQPLAEPAATIAPLLFAGLFNVTNHSMTGSRDESHAMPSLSAQFDFGDDSMSYVTVSRGAKSGGFDTRSNNSVIDGGTFEFEDEQATSIELGAKLRLGDGLGDLNVALFHTKFEDMQVSTYDGVVGYNVTNAGEAVSKGIELDGRWSATSRLTVAGSLALIDFEFRDYIGECYYGQTPDAPDGINCSYRGKSNQYVPDLKAVLSLDHFHMLSNGFAINSIVDISYSDDFYTSPTLDPSQIQDAYTMINARIGLSSPEDRWSVALLIRNLTDEVVTPYSIATPLAGASFGAPGAWAFVEPPRTTAVEFAVNF